jgi:hypothetical protein
VGLLGNSIELRFTLAETAARSVRVLPTVDREVANDAADVSGVHERIRLLNAVWAGRQERATERPPARRTLLASLRPDHATSPGVATIASLHLAFAELGTSP